MSTLKVGARAAVVAVLLAATGVASAVQYVTPVPLGKSATTPVGSVATGVTQVPIITWGGDIATVYANGNQATTAPGSIFGKLGLNLRLVREDVFAKQLDAYLAGRSPYLRGTLGMINMAAEAASRDPRTKPVVVYQMTWSAGGDALVVGEGIHAVEGPARQDDRVAGLRAARRLPDQDPVRTPASPRATSR